jgi:hypothetical protein
VAGAACAEVRAQRCESSIEVRLFLKTAKGAGLKRCPFQAAANATTYIEVHSPTRLLEEAYHLRS